MKYNWFVNIRNESEERKEGCLFGAKFGAV